jgi:hypothetical protein
MPIVRPSLGVAPLAAALIALAVPAGAQNANPLAGATRAPQAAATTDSFGGLIIPAPERGQLRPDPDNAATGGVVFADELGWYRFMMPDGGTTALEGEMRQFSFPAGTIPTTCFAIKVKEASFAKFPITQIQAELDTLYPKFDSAITGAGFAIEHRESLVLDSAGQRSAVPLKLLAWDSRSDNGIRATWTLMPSQIGYLLFACMGADPGHQREVIQRYLRIGSVMTSGK